MTRLNWERARENQLLREHGTEPHDGGRIGMFDSAKARAATTLRDILSCKSCGSDAVTLKPPSGPHAGAVHCAVCNSFRWLSKREVERVHALRHATVTRK